MKSTSNPPFRPAFAFAALAAVFAIVSASAAGETAKYLWYHHAPPSATVLIVK